MHFHPILLVNAENLEEAKIKAGDFADCESGEHSFFDYGGITEDTETEWNKPLSEVKAKLPVDTHIADALSLLSKANAELIQNNFDMAGYYFRKAGELFSQCFCSECTVFNIEYYDYSQPDEEGWYAIEADFHC
jgi:hypothetical protein